MSYKDLVDIANKLDKIGMNKDADFIDSLLEKVATQTENSLEQTNRLEKTIRDLLSNIIFYIPWDVKQSLKTKEAYLPHMMFGEELEEHIEKYRSLESLLTAAKQRYQRLVDELLAFIADDPKLSLIDVNKLTNTSYEEDWYFNHGSLSRNDIFRPFMWSIKNGGSWGYNEVLKGSFREISTPKEKYKEEANKAIENLRESLVKIPENLEDLMQKENISSKEELAEALYYVANGITGNRIRARGIGKNTISPINSKIGNVTLSTILRAGREFVRIRTRKYEQNYSYQLVQKEEDISYWPREPEEPAEDEAEYISKRYDKAEYAKSFIDDYIEKFFHKIYQKTDAKSFSAIYNFLNEILNKYLEEKFNSIKRVFSAYNFNERDFELYKQNFKERLLEDYKKNNREAPPFGKLYNASTNLNSSYIVLDLLFNAYPKAKDLFKEKAKQYFNTIDFSSIEEASIDVVQIVTKIDEEIARDLEAGNFDLYSKILVKLRDEKVGEIEIERYNFKSAGNIYDLLPDTSSNILSDPHHPANDPNNERYYLKEPETIRKLIAASRLLSDGVLGFRSFRNIFNPAYLTDFFMVKPMIVHRDNPSSAESKELRKTQERIDDLLDKLYEAIDSVEDQSERKAIREAWRNEHGAEVAEANSTLIKIRMSANYYNTENSEQMFHLVRELAPKVIYKIYAEEEDFMTGKRNEVYDASDRIAKKIGIKNITEFLYKESYRGISLPNRIINIFKDDNNKLVKLYFALSSPNEMNSVERMHSFLIKLLKFHTDIAAHDSGYSLRHLADKKINFQDFINKFSGTKNEKIKKILSVVKLADNNSDIDHLILQSRYVDKMDLNIFKKAIDVFSDIVNMRLETKVVGYDWDRSAITEEVDMLNNINDIRQNLVSSFGEEHAEKMVSSRFIETIKEVYNIEKLDDFIEYLSLDSFGFDETTFLNTKEILAILGYGLNIITQISALSKYYKKAKPKNKSLFKGNMTTESFRFRVLEDLDPYHFQVGIDTDCCQAIGGAGEKAAVDSFINPLAGVILLEVKNKGEWVLAAQSYFHYVPEQEIIILDNIEAVPDRKLKKSIREITGYSFAEMYFVLAKHLESQGIAEVLVGKEYTTIISKHEFEKDSRKKDPRSFSVSRPYSDYRSKNSYNILSPKFEMYEMPDIINDESVTASYKSIMIKLASIGSNKIKLRGRKIISLSTILLRKGFVKEAQEVLDIFR